MALRFEALLKKGHMVKKRDPYLMHESSFLRSVIAGTGTRKVDYSRPIKLQSSSELGSEAQTLALIHGHVICGSCAGLIREDRRMIREAVS